MKAKKLSEILMKYPEADVKVREIKRVKLENYSSVIQTQQIDLPGEAVLCAGEIIVIATDLLKFD